jgi:type II secretory pathway component PulM
MWKFFKRNKIKMEQIQLENEALKVQLESVGFNLKLADGQLLKQKREIEALYAEIKNLNAQVQQLNMLGQTSQTNKNDSRNY